MPEFNIFAQEIHASGYGLPCGSCKDVYWIPPSDSIWKYPLRLVVSPTYIP
jgi:hypothetical protein